MRRPIVSASTIHPWWRVSARTDPVKRGRTSAFFAKSKETGFLRSDLATIRES
jgi:hypothetical protein